MRLLSRKMPFLRVFYPLGDALSYNQFERRSYLVLRIWLVAADFVGN